MLNYREIVLTAYVEATARREPPAVGNEREAHWAIKQSDEIDAMLFGEGETEELAWADAAEKLLAEAVMRR